MAKLSFTAAEIDALLGKVSPMETEVDENRAALAEVIDSGQKNILQNTATSAEINGVAFTVNSDGSVTATGTATANADFTLSNLTGYPTSGQYILSGCPEGGGANTYRIQIYQVAADYGSAVEFISQNRLNVYIRISAGQTVDNLVFKPMICSKAAWAISQEYVPYRSGSGGGGATIDTLWSDSSGATVGAQYQLANSVSNYDVIYLKCGNSDDITANNDYVQTSFMPALIEQNENLSIECFYFKRYFRVVFSNNTFTVLNSAATDETGNVKPTIFEVIGIKY